MHIHDLELQVVDDLLAQLGHHPVLLLVLLFSQLLQVAIKHLADVPFQLLLTSPEQLLGCQFFLLPCVLFEFEHGVDVVEDALDGG